MAPPGAGSGRFRRVAAFFHRHPVLLLLGFTPGIPEYLSGSTAVWPLVLAPGGFFLFLGLNLALYGPGVLLLREAWVRRGRSWAALLLYGTAYALLEEGTALSTLFNPHASVVGTLGSYGRFGGVNLVWTIGVVGVHVLYSVGIPILLLGLALPETRGRSLLTHRQIALAVLVYGADIALLSLSTSGRWSFEPAWVVGAVLLAALLWLVAWRLPSGTLEPPRERPTYGPRVFFLAGLAVFPLLILIPGVGEAAHAPALVAGVVQLLVAALLFVGVRRTIGRRSNEPQLIALALGATLPLVASGLLSQLFFPLVLGIDVVYALFFYAIWQKYRPEPTPAGPPAAVLAA